jgi:hypothetical protein
MENELRRKQCLCKAHHEPLQAGSADNAPSPRRMFLEMDETMTESRANPTFSA